jgi:cephalosporin-C deacetylase-like acetyl esterase
VGLVDTSCPAPGIIAAFNQIQAPKELVVMEWSDHQGRTAPHTAYYERAGTWMKQLATGNKAPVSK